MIVILKLDVVLVDETFIWVFVYLCRQDAGLCRLYHCLAPVGRLNTEVDSQVLVVLFSFLFGKFGHIFVVVFDVEGLIGTALLSFEFPVKHATLLDSFKVRRGFFQFELILIANYRYRSRLFL